MSTVVTHNADRERYEITVDGTLAGFTEAHPRGSVLLFSHTQIEHEFEGHGLATQLIQGALDDVRARGLRIRVTCPFVLAFLDKHPDYADLLA
jgi:predicted GNAT family acetyltransferase